MDDVKDQKLAAVAQQEPADRGATRPDRRDPAAVYLGRLGGIIGGRVRADRLTAEQRREIAKIAAETRWGKRGVPVS